MTKSQHPAPHKPAASSKPAQPAPNEPEAEDQEPAERPITAGPSIRREQE